MLEAGKLDRQIDIEYPATGQDATYGTQTVTWTLLARVWAEVQDVLPSRAEATERGLTAAKNPTRVRFRYRSDVTSAMRIVVRDGSDRVLQIVGGPAEIGRREGTEVLCEAYSS